MQLQLLGQSLELDPSGAVFWPRYAMLVVADLHLEKGGAFARRGSLLPPYDSHATLARLEALIAPAIGRTRWSAWATASTTGEARSELSPDLFDRLCGADPAAALGLGHRQPRPVVPLALGGAAVAELARRRPGAAPRAHGRGRRDRGPSPPQGAAAHPPPQPVPPLLRRRRGPAAAAGLGQLYRRPQRA